MVQRESFLLALVQVCTGEHCSVRRSALTRFSTSPGDIASGSASYVAEAAEKGVYVVVSSKINAGAVVPSSGDTTIAGGFLNPVKARIQLQFAIANGLSADGIRDTFEGVLAKCELYQ